MVDGVVEEEHLGGLDEQRDRGEHARLDQPADTGAEPFHDLVDDGSQQEEAAQRHDEREDARAEHVDQHLEAGLDLALPELVKLLHEPCGERRHDHRTDEHVHLAEAAFAFGSVGIELVDQPVRTSDDTERRERADNTAAHVVDHLAARIGDEQRKQVVDRRIDERRDCLVRERPHFDEQGGDDAPRDQRGDVRHDHSREERAELLNRRTNGGPLLDDGVTHGSHAYAS